jgi:hypothetical protein
MNFTVEQIADLFSTLRGGRPTRVIPFVFSASDTSPFSQGNHAYFGMVTFDELPVNAAYYTVSTELASCTLKLLAANNQYHDLLISNGYSAVDLSNSAGSSLKQGDYQQVQNVLFDSADFVGAARLYFVGFKIFIS